MPSLTCRLAIHRGRFQLPEAATADLHSGQGSRQESFWSPDLVILQEGEILLGGVPQSARQLASYYRHHDRRLPPALGGHFRLVVLDERQQQIHCLSDKFATHPIYYQVDPYQLRISGHLGNLHEQGERELTLSAQSLYHYLYFHCIPSPHTIYEGISKLPPATLLQWDAGQLATRLYWRPSFQQQAGDSPAQLQQQLRDALEQAVGRYADRPRTGAFLSGGLDSSSVTAYLSHTSGRRIDTFTIGFAEPGYDETEYAALVAKAFNTRHHVYQMTPADLYQQLPKVAAHFDEPFGNSSALPTFYCGQLAKSQGMDNLLAGDGGDELFAGNSRYAKQKIFEAYYHCPATLRRLLEAHMPGIARRLPLTLVKKAASYVHQAAIGLPHRLQHYNFLHQHPATEVFNAGLCQQLDLTLPSRLLQTRYSELSNLPAVDNMLYLDWKFTLADNDLVKVNRMTELAGIQVAYPMLDDAMVAMATRIPASTKLPGQQLRAFYKASLGSILPRGTINKPKQGFGLPFGKWLSQDPQLRDLVQDTLHQLKQRDIIRPAFIDRALEMHEQVHSGFFGELVWLMMSLEIWLDSRRNAALETPPQHSAEVINLF